MNSELANNYLNSDKANNPFAKEWTKQEKEKKIPSTYRKLVFVDYKEFVSKILKKDPILIEVLGGRLLPRC